MINSTLERFRIIGLHGRKNVDITIKENTLILVGEMVQVKQRLRILFCFSGPGLLIQFRLILL